VESESSPSDRVDEEIAAFLPDIDLTLIRENLRLSITERFENLMSLQRFAEELRNGMKEVQSG